MNQSWWVYPIVAFVLGALMYAVATMYGNFICKQINPGPYLETLFRTATAGICLMLVGIGMLIGGAIK